MSDAVISVQIKAVIDDLLAKLKTATSSTGQAVADMKNSLLGLGHGAREAGAHHEGLIGTLREFKGEATANSRAASFFTRQLVEMVPAADGAGHAIKSLISIGLGGASLFAAVEAAVFIFGQLKEAADEHAQQMKELKAAYTETFESGLKKLLALQKELRGKQGKSDDTWDEIITERNKKLDELRGKIAELMESSATRKFFSGLTLGLVQDKDYDAIEQLKLEKDKVRQGVRDLQPTREVTANDARAKEAAEVGRELEGIESKLKDEIVRINVEKEAKIAELNHRGFEDVAQRAKLIEAVETEAAEKITRLKESRQVAFDQQVLNLTKQRMTATEAIEAELNVKVEQLQLQYRDRKSAADQKQLQTLIQQEEAAANRRYDLNEAFFNKLQVAANEAYRKLHDARLDQLVKEDQQVQAIQQSFEDLRYGERYASAAAASRARELQETDIIRQAQKDRLISFEEMERLIQEVHTKAQHEREKAYAQENQTWLKSFVHPLTSSFQSAVTSMLDGTKDFATGVRDILTGMLKSIVDGLVQLGTKALEESILEHSIHMATAQASVTESAGVGGAAAAAQTAAIPLVGPFAAVEAGLAMAAAIEGAFLPFASAAGGADLGAEELLVHTHPKELILPPALAEGARRTFLRAAGGGQGGDGQVVVHLHNPILDDAWWRSNQGRVLKLISDAVAAGRIR